jgi:hypothetical protein
MARFEVAAEAAQSVLAGHSVLNVNSTATGGGVAEMLQTLLAYVRGAGVDPRWLVIEGDPEFFAITKRIHNGLYGSPGDGGELGQAERAHYERVFVRNADELWTHVKSGDVVLIHDPQPAGLMQIAKDAGARVLWRCHVGVDRPNPWTERAWEFLRPYLIDVDAYVVSHPAFAPPWADAANTHHPAIHRSLLGQERAHVTPKRSHRPQLSACWRVTAARRSFLSSAATAPPAGSTGTSTSSRAARRYRLRGRS